MNTNWGTWYWPLFLIISSVWLLIGLGVPELLALFNESKIDNTLSYYAQTQLHLTGTITRHDIAWYLSLLCWAMVTTILTWHIWFVFGG